MKHDISVSPTKQHTKYEGNAINIRQRSTQASSCDRNLKTHYWYIMSFASKMTLIVQLALILKENQLPLRLTLSPLKNILKPEGKKNHQIDYVIYHLQQIKKKNLSHLYGRNLNTTSNTKLLNQNHTLKYQ